MILSKAPVVALILSAVTMVAQSQVTVFGVGTESCGTYVEMRRTGGPGADLIWRHYFGGFASGHNWYKSANALRGVDGNVDLDAGMVWTDTYCRAHPNESWVRAISKYIEFRVGAPR